jgi:hypothetical protein
MRDPTTNNFRTVTIAVSAAELGKLLSGEEDRIIMRDQFVQGNFCDLSLRVKNASDYSNFKQVGSDLGLINTKPFITLKRSALRDMAEFNGQVGAVSDQFVNAMQSLKVAMAQGGEQFRRGVSRYSCLSRLCLVAQG